MVFLFSQFFETISEFKSRAGFLDILGEVVNSKILFVSVLKWAAKKWVRCTGLNFFADERKIMVLGKLQIV